MVKTESRFEITALESLQAWRRRCGGFHCFFWMMGLGSRGSLFPFARGWPVRWMQIKSACLKLNSPGRGDGIDIQSKGGGGKKGPTPRLLFEDCRGENSAKDMVQPMLQHQSVVWLQSYTLSSWRCRRPQLVMIGTTSWWRAGGRRDRNLESLYPQSVFLHVTCSWAQIFVFVLLNKVFMFSNPKVLQSSPGVQPFKP